MDVNKIHGPAVVAWSVLVDADPTDIHRMRGLTPAFYLHSRWYRQIDSPPRAVYLMELTVLEKTDDLLRIELAGEDHTFMNVLKGALLETDGVGAATYDMNPEQSGGQVDPILTLKTEGSVDPLDALTDAAEHVESMSGAFADAFIAAQ